jgi:hypothetical protein
MTARAIDPLLTPEEAAAPRLRDWFDHTAAEGRIAVAERALLGPRPLLSMGIFWGDGLNIICTGDGGHASREASRLHRNMMVQVSHRLPIWC